MENEMVTLSNISDCSLEDQFQKAYPEILSKLEPGKKAKITMTIEVQRPEGTSTLVNVKTKFDTKMPAGDPRVNVYTMNGDTFVMNNDVSAAKKPTNVVLFGDKKAE
jgi:hypothetical protein